MKIKVCGMRDASNIAALAELPIDFIGFIFYKHSKRYVKQLALPPLPTTIKKVGVFVNAKEEAIEEAVEQYALDYVQLHGDESVAFCEHIQQHATKVIKAFRIGGAIDFKEVADYASACTYFLFDTKGQNYGGNGVSFDWQLLENYKGTVPFLLSGGIGLEAVERLRRLRHPQLIGVDVNSRFETQVALKNIQKLKTFTNELCC